MAGFSSQMESLQARSDAAMRLGPPAWLQKDQICYDGPLSKDHIDTFFNEGFLVLPIFR